MDFKNRLGNELLFFDGAMGTMLQAAGLPAGGLPELWNMTNDGAVYDIHSAYVKAGCNILKTNTFGANRLKLAGSGYTPAQVVSAGVSIAKRAANRNEGVYIALDIGPTGKLLAPFGELDFEAAVEIFAEMVTAGAKAGADLVLIETMSDAYEIKAAMLAAKENCDLPVLVTFTPDKSGRLLTGGDILTALCLIEGLGADAVGLNCGLGPAQMKSFLQELVKYSSIPIIINPNAGIPELKDGKTIFHVTPEEFAADMADIAARANIVGGCCGTTPAHIAGMVDACRGIAPLRVIPKGYTAVSSYGRTVVFGGQTVVIGERINPTGKPDMMQALREGDIDYLCDEALDQIEAGAEILDINVGMPGVDEAEMLADAVTELQGITNIPLQIDTADINAAGRALRLYNGRPLLNSVNGKKESLEAALPLAKKYGAAVIALTLDENGIPETAQGRVEIAKKIIAAAQSHGIAKKNIIVDPLTLPIATGTGGAFTTLEAMERIRGELGVHTMLGISNVSFGLPDRERLNAAFLTLAMGRGLSAAIIDPMSSTVTDALCIGHTLIGHDPDCGQYIDRFSGRSASDRRPD